MTSSWLDDIFGRPLQQRQEMLKSRTKKRRKDRVVPIKENKANQAASMKKIYRRENDELLNRASRLSAVAEAVEGIDLKSLVDPDLDAVTAAAQALETAIRCAWNADGEEEAQSLAARAQRESMEKKRRAKNREELKFLEAKRREELIQTLSLAHHDAARRKEHAITDAAHRARVQREVKALAAESRRNYQQAVQRFGSPAKLNNPSHGESFIKPSSDPLIEKARTMCENAAKMTENLFSQQVSTPRDRTPNVYIVSEEETALVAKANALLADYHPASKALSPRKPRAPRPASPKYDPFRSDVLHKQQQQRKKAISKNYS